MFRYCGRDPSFRYRYTQDDNIKTVITRSKVYFATWLSSAVSLFLAEEDHHAHKSRSTYSLVMTNVFTSALRPQNDRGGIRN